MIATDRMQAARIATGGKDAHVVPRVYGRVGYDVPVAQSATFRLKPYDTASDDDDASVVNEANAYAEGSVFRSQAGAGSTVDDPGGHAGGGSKSRTVDQIKKKKPTHLLLEPWIKNQLNSQSPPLYTVAVVAAQITPHSITPKSTLHPPYSTPHAAGYFNLCLFMSYALL